MPPVRVIVDFFLYGSIWIAFCAVGQLYLTASLFEIPIPGSYFLLIFTGTISVYSVHHLIRLRKLGTGIRTARLATLIRLKPLIRGTGILAAFASIFFLFQLSEPAYWALLALPALVAAAYIFPVLGNGQSIRDIHGLKIFLVAPVWGWIVVGIPLVLESSLPVTDMILVYTERTLYLLAATIPFEIRDIRIDQYSHVRSIPATLGIRRSRILAMLLLCCSAAINLVCVLYGIFPAYHLWFYAVFFPFTLGVIAYSTPGRQDTYFTGLVDGTMLILPLLYLLFSFRVSV